MSGAARSEVTSCGPARRSGPPPNQRSHRVRMPARWCPWSPGTATRRPQLAPRCYLRFFVWPSTRSRPRTLLQALLPRIKVENVLTARYGHGIAERWQSPADTVGDLVAECFSALKRHAGEDKHDVARLVLQEATRRMRTARQAQRRYQERTVLLAPGHAHVAPDHLSTARSAPERLATVLMEAVRDSRLTRADARLVYGTRVKGLPASEVGRRAGMPAKAVYYVLARAERALVSRAA